MEKLKNIFKMDSYDDALEHILTRHGGDGIFVFEDNDSPPVVWHEFAHTSSNMGAGTWDHEHEGTTPETTQEMVKSAFEMMENPNFADKLVEHMHEEDQKVREKYVEEN